MKRIGRYEIIEELGQGAMGAVCKARDPMMDRVVAVKTILATAVSGPLAGDYRERFFREARAAGRLAHPGIVTVFDVGEFEGTPFLVMEFIAGRTLQSILESAERFEFERICEIGEQLAEALHYAHKNGVVHRDIKPANILITSEGRPKIADFGVAKLTESQVTSTKQLLGTPSFMAPEQFTGSVVDGRSDLFALGVVLYWMATGDKPFTGDTLMAVSYKIVHTDPVPPRKLNPGVPRGLEQVILRCMEKDPASRYQSGEAVASDLRALREGRGPATFAGQAPIESLAQHTVVSPQRLPETSVERSGPRTHPGLAAHPGDALDTAETLAVIPVRGAAAREPEMRSGPGFHDRASAHTPEQKPAQLPPKTPESSRQELETTQPLPQHDARAKTVRHIIWALVAVFAIGTVAYVVMQRNRALDEVALVPLPSANKAAAPAAGTQPPGTQVPAAGTPDVAKVVSDSMNQAQRAIDNAGKLQSLGKAGAKTPLASGEVRPPAPPAPPGNVPLRLSVRATHPVNVVLRPDSLPQSSSQMQPGQTVELEAQKEILVFASNAAAVELKLNGKALPPLGAEGKSGMARVTKAGLDTSLQNDVDFARKLGKTPGSEVKYFERAEVTGGREPDFEGVGLGSARVQSALAKVPSSGRINILVKGIPASLHLVVRVDEQVLLRHDPSRVSGPARRDARSAELAMEEQRYLPPGHRSIQVFVGVARQGAGATRQVTAEWKPGQARTLHIALDRAGLNSEATAQLNARLKVTLE